mgnify:CR=1 FL=1
MKTVTTRRLTRSMTTPIAKRLRPRQGIVTGSPPSKLPRRNLIVLKEPIIHSPIKADDEANYPSPTAIVAECDVNHPSPYSSPSNTTVEEATEVHPTPNNVEVQWGSSQLTYPPAPPSASSIFSEWLLNHPGIHDHRLTLEVIRQLDYRLRDSA